jgi:hypothetical protein
MSEKKNQSYEQQQESYDPEKDTMEKQFEEALKDINLTARKLKVKGGLYKVVAGE